MSGAGRAFVALDRGTATLAVALVGRIAGRWRLLASLAVPAGVESEAAVALLGLTVERTDPDLAAELHLDGGAALALPRLVAETTPTPTLAVVGVTERALGPLGAVAERAGWRTWRASMERLDPLAMLRFLLDERVEAILAGAGDPAGADERSGLAELAAVVAAAGERRPHLPIVLAGGLAAVAERLPLFAGRRPMATTGSGTPAPEPVTTGATVAAEGAEPDATPEAGAEPSEAGAEPSEAGAEPSEAGAEPSEAGAEPSEAGAEPSEAGAEPPEVSAGSSAPETSGATDAPGSVADLGGSDDERPILFAPAATAGDRPGEPLRWLLARLADRDDDGRAALARTAATVAAVLARRLELVEVGHDGGLRVRVDPPNRPDRAPEIRLVRVPSAALVPGEVTDDILDGVLAWSTHQVERSRLRDGLAELRRDPWADAAGDGARLRLAAAEAALARLAAATPDLGALPAPDLLVLAGGVWSTVPGPAVALAAANALRRPGAWQVAYDHARLLGPLGTIEAEDERAGIVGELVDDLLLPIGSLVMPAGLRAEKDAGSLVVHGTTGPTELELVPGGLELVDLAPGERAPVEFRFARPVVLGTRGRRFAFDIAGGLGGLLVDLRDVPLRLPERAARRRELLRAWQTALWPGSDDGREGRLPG